MNVTAAHQSEKRKNLGKGGNKHKSEYERRQSQEQGGDAASSFQCDVVEVEKKQRKGERKRTRKKNS